MAPVVGRSSSIGVVSVDASSFGSATIAGAIERGAHALGYGVRLASVASPESFEVLSAVARLVGQGVDGLVFDAGIEEPARGLDGLIDVPFVAATAGSGGRSPSAWVDEEAGAASITRLLLDGGHETVWHIAGPQHWPAARRRLDGWRKTLQRAGATAPGPLHGDWSAGSGYALGRRLAADPSVTAIFAANDQMAMGVLRALHEAGREVGADVSVAGFDDVPEARFLTPSLTTVSQDLDALGRAILELLVAAMRGVANARAEVVLTPTLIVRESSGRAPRQ